MIAALALGRIVPRARPATTPQKEIGYEDILHYGTVGVADQSHCLGFVWWRMAIAWSRLHRLSMAMVSIMVTAPKTRDEWIAAAMSSLEQGAAMLRLEAQEWRERANGHTVIRTAGQQRAIAVANEGMAKQMETLCQMMTDLLVSEASPLKGNDHE